MHQRNTVERDVRDLIVQVMGVEPARVGPEFDQRSVGAWTSLNHLMLISQLEERFGVVFTSVEVTQLTSYTAIVQKLEERLLASA